MSREKQIEEMAISMVDSDNKEAADALSLFFVKVAEHLYNAGYRKQIKAEWIISSDGYYPYCSNCKHEPKNGVMTDFCPSCGAYMKGGAE